MTHAPTLTDGVYRCSACAFHAVTTNDGGIRVIDSGDGRQMHLAAIAQQQIELRAYVEQVRMGLIGRAAECDARVINRLVRYIEAEYLS